MPSFLPHIEVKIKMFNYQVKILNKNIYLGVLFQTKPTK